jgi:hypothetical protein
MGLDVRRPDVAAKVAAVDFRDVAGSADGPALQLNRHNTMAPARSAAPGGSAAYGVAVRNTPIATAPGWWSMYSRA